MGADDAQEPERCDSLSVPEKPHTLSETPVHLPPPRPPPRYRREKEKMEAAQVLKQLGDDEAARGADFRPYSPVEGAEGKIWDAARTIEQCHSAGIYPPGLPSQPMKTRRGQPTQAV